MKVRTHSIGSVMRGPRGYLWLVTSFGWCLLAHSTLLQIFSHIGSTLAYAIFLHPCLLPYFSAGVRPRHLLQIRDSVHLGSGSDLFRLVFVWVAIHPSRGGGSSNTGLLFFTDTCDRLFWTTYPRPLDVRASVLHWPFTCFTSVISRYLDMFKSTLFSTCHRFDLDTYLHCHPTLPS